MIRNEVAGKAAMIKKQRVAFVFAGAGLLCFGIGALSRGSLHYRNWWGGEVFAPFAILIGILAFIAAARWRGKP